MLAQQLLVAEAVLHRAGHVPHGGARAARGERREQAGGERWGQRPGMLSLRAAERLPPPARALRTAAAPGRTPTGTCAHAVHPGPSRPVSAWRARSALCAALGTERVGTHLHLLASHLVQTPQIKQGLGLHQSRSICVFLWGVGSCPSMIFPAQCRCAWP